METVEDFRAFVEILHGPLLWPFICAAVVFFVVAICKEESPFLTVLSLFAGYVLFFYSCKYGIFTSIFSPEWSKVLGVLLALGLCFLGVRLSFGESKGTPTPAATPTSLSSTSTQGTSVAGGDTDAAPGDFGAPSGDGGAGD
jgi:hypothetical protein